MQFVKQYKGKGNERNAVVSRDGGAYRVEFFGARGSVNVQQAKNYDSRDEACDEAQEFIEGSMSNVEKLVMLMEWSDAGPLIQGFVMVGLQQYADAVLKGGPEACDSPMVSGRAWVKCAESAKAALL